MFTRAELLAAAGVAPRGAALPERFSGAAVDSRLVRPGELFVALCGTQTDGHRFIPDAIAAGASAVLCANMYQPAGGTMIAQINVADPLQVLQDLARARLARQRGVTVVGITGSSGKTSTKEAIAALLARLAPTHKTPASFNTETGLPLTILGLEPRHRFAVLEMGAQWVGEIAMLCRIAPPQIGVVTAVGPAHLQYFGSIEAVERGKSELAQALPPAGLAVLNADDERVRRMAGKTAARVVTFGRARAADVRALRLAGDPLLGLRFTLAAGGATARVRLRIPGAYAVYTALAAAAVALDRGLPLAEVAAGLGELRAPKRRGEIKPGVNGSTVVDDSYNANRQSVEGALALLGAAHVAPGGRRWAVLGDMFELGAHAAAEHAQVGATVAATADELVAIGADARHLAVAARQAGMAAARIHLCAANPEDAAALAAARDAAAALLRERLRPGDIVLVKGSLGMGMDAIVRQITSAPTAGAAAD
ncbi:MAG TPA: UDP-N-acetylmuramoyl-tripeptide--D-alanyl-D-alanine ligase [Ktedonobacterales bacterium]